MCLPSTQRTHQPTGETTMLNPEEATTHTKRGASSQSWRTANPRGLLGSLITKFPKKEGQSENDYREQMLDTFSNLALNNNKMLLSIIEYWFTNNYRSLLAAQQVDENVVRERAKLKEAELKKTRDA